MTHNEIRGQGLNVHEERAEQDLKLSLREKERGVAAGDRDARIERLVHSLYFVFAALELLLGLRVLLHLVGADSANGLAFINMVSGLFVGPFAGLLQNPAFGGVVLEVTTLIAMLVYAIVGWLAGRVIWLTMNRTQ